VRTAFIETLFSSAQSDQRVVLLVGDLGFGVVTSFMEELPDQFINAGVAEQNMTGMAAGMALCGRIAFTYSIANFPTLRCLEQIRNDVCYHNTNVRIVSVGGGMAYGALGMSHHATEDLAIMRALPNMLVVAPGDPAEARMATLALIEEHEGPAYLRLGRAGEPEVHAATPEFRLGKAIAVRDGSDLTLIATGGMLYNSVKAADVLSAEGISCRVISMHTVKPLDRETILACAAETRAVFTVEEHSVIGGLGGAVAELLMEADCGPVNFRRIGLADQFSTLVGDQEFLRQQYGLDPEGIARQVRSLLG
jgi:transketolase